MRRKKCETTIFGHFGPKRFDDQNFENLWDGPGNAQNDIILTIFGQKWANLSIVKGKNCNYTRHILRKIIENKFPIFSQKKCENLSFRHFKNLLSVGMYKNESCNWSSDFGSREKSLKYYITQFSWNFIDHQ